MKNFNLMTLVALLCVSALCGCGGSDKGDKPTANAETELEGVETSVMDLPVEKRLELAKKYESTYCFPDGLALVELNGKCGFVDKSGKEVIPCVYDFAWGFSDGLARVWLNGKWGFIDKNGKEVIPCVYDNVYATAVDILVGTVKGSDGKKTKYYYDKNGDFLGN